MSYFVWFLAVLRAGAVRLLRALFPLWVAVARDVQGNELLGIVSVLLATWGLGLIWFPLAPLGLGLVGVVVAVINARMR